MRLSTRRIEMLSIPSKDGVSHSPMEFSTWVHVSHGTGVRFRSIPLLDAAMDRSEGTDTVTRAKISAGAHRAPRPLTLHNCAQARKRTISKCFLAPGLVLLLGGRDKTGVWPRRYVDYVVAAHYNHARYDAAISTLRKAYAAFNRGDIESCLEPLDANIEWGEPLEFPGGGMYHGHEGVRRYLTRSREGMAEGSSEPRRFLPAGDRIVGFVLARVRPQGSHAWIELDLADVYTFRDGKVIQMRAFADQKEALRSIGRGDAVPAK